MCSNCGYGFVAESQQPQRAYHACPRCGKRMTPPVIVGTQEESTGTSKPYKPLVERNQ